MAILKNGLQFTGSVGNLSAYTRRGSEKVIIRTKGGASRDKIKKSPNFKRTRESNSDFALCMKVVKGLREAIKPVRHMADYNFTPALSSRTRQVQALDQENGPGKREVYISKHHYLLEGFQLHREFPFDSVISSPLSYNIDRATLSATIHLPQLAPGANINIPWKRPL
jgi:hypothetical protein